MEGSQLREFIKKSVSSSEIGTTSPYESVQSTGNSGLSFGALQNDVGNSSSARAAFREILDAEVALGVLSQVKANSIYSKAAQKIQLDDGERTLVDNALRAHKDIVDNADAKQLDVIEGYVNTAIEAAAANPNGAGSLDRNSLDLQFVAELAMWGNRTGGLNASAQYLKTADTVSRENYETNYLSVQAQFTTNGEVFSRWQERVDEAALSGLLKMSIEDVGKGLFVPGGSKGVLDYFKATLSTPVANDVLLAVIKDFSSSQLSNVQGVRLDKKEGVLISIPLSQGGAGNANLVYSSEGVRINFSGQTLVTAPRGAQIFIKEGVVELSYTYEGLEASYLLSGRDIATAWKNSDKSLVVERVYTLDGTLGSTQWTQKGESFRGADSELAVFIAQILERSTQAFQSDASQTKQASISLIINTAAEGVITALDNSASLSYLQRRMALDNVSDRWAPFALGSSIPDSLRVAGSLSAAVQQALVSWQQRWNEARYTSVARVDIGPLEIGGGSRYHLPLVLDLDGRGIELVAPWQSNAVFDHDADGRQSAVGWVGRSNGILVFDTNGNGVVDSSAEWFGESFAGRGSISDTSQNGFSALASLVTTGSGVFSRETALIDPVTGKSYFDTVNVWIDGNQNGISEKGELKTLTELGIQSIDLHSIHDGRQIAGGLIDSTAGFTLVDGTRRDIADIGLSELSSQGAPTASAINPASLIFAEYVSKGYAEMASGQAKGIDAALATKAPDFSPSINTLQTWMATSRSRTENGIPNPMFRTPDPRLITTYHQSTPLAANGSTAGIDVLNLLQAGTRYYSTVRETLQTTASGASAITLAQTAAQIANVVSTQANRDKAESLALAASNAWGQAASTYLDTLISWEGYTGKMEVLRGEFNALIPVNSSYAGHLPSGYTFWSPGDAGFAADAFVAYSATLQLFRDLKLGIDGTLGAFAQSAGYAKAYVGVAGGTVTVESGFNLLLVGQGKQNFVLNNNVDHVLLSQASGQASLSGFQGGAAGDQLQFLGLGNSVVVSRTTNGLHLVSVDGQHSVDLAGVKADDLDLFANIAGVRSISFAGMDQAGTRSLRSDRFYDGQVHINEIIASNFGDTLVGGAQSSILKGGSGNDTFVVSGSGYWIDGGQGRDVISYATQKGGVTVNLVTGKDSLGSSLYNVENITGSAWRDTLIGSSADNTLIGGQGNDWMEGAGGNDTYIFGRGDGADTILNGVATNTVASSVLHLRGTIKASDLWLSRNGNDLLISVLGTQDQIEVRDWFAADYRKLAAIELDNGLRVGSDGVALIVSSLDAWKSANLGFDPRNPGTAHLAPSLAPFFSEQVVVAPTPSASNVALETKRQFESGNVLQAGRASATEVAKLASGLASSDTALTTARGLAGQVSNLSINTSLNTYRYTSSYDTDIHILSTWANFDSTNPFSGRSADVTSYQRIYGWNTDAFYIQPYTTTTRPPSTTQDIGKLERGTGVVSSSMADLTMISGKLSNVARSAQTLDGLATARQSALEKAVQANDLKSASAKQQAKDAAASFEQGLAGAVVGYQGMLVDLADISGALARTAERLTGILPPTRSYTTQSGLGSTTTTFTYKFASPVDQNKYDALQNAKAVAQNAWSIANSGLTSHLATFGALFNYRSAQFLSQANATATANAAGDLLISGAGNGHIFNAGAGNDTFVFTGMGGTSAHTIQGFQGGLVNDRLLLVPAGAKTAYLDETSANQTRVTFNTGPGATAAITLAGVGLDKLSLYDNLLGVDTADFGQFKRGINVRLDSLTPRDLDGLTHVQNLSGSAFADRLVGDNQDNVLIGGAGDDVLLGKGGNNTLDGGEGRDTVSYEESLAGVVVDLARKTASNGYGGTDTLISIENVVGSSKDDILSGDSGNNVLQGGAGNDLLIGGGGYDQYVVAKGDGHDTVVNGFGAARGELLINNESPNTLWFERVGSDLSVQVLGSDTLVTVQGWFDGSTSKLDKISVGGSRHDYLLGSQVDQLVQAMSAFTGSHPGFDPKASTVISDASLLAVVNSNWLTTPGA